MSTEQPTVTAAVHAPRAVLAGSHGDTDSGFSVRAPAPSAPEGAGVVLWKHQRDALAFIADKPAALLAMGLGSGKSAVAIADLDARNVDLALVLCPKSVASVWPGQVEKHSPRDWHVLCLDTGTTKKRAALLRQAVALPHRPLLVVLNYDVLPYTEIGNAVMATRWQAVIMDEGHKLKAPAGKISRFCSRLADRVPVRRILTGTPMPHSPGDVYAQFRALDKRIFGASHTAFRARYAVMGGFQNHQVVAWRDLDDLHRRMYTTTFRCRTSDVLDLPPFQDVDRYCDLTPESRRVYEQLKEDMIAELDAGVVTADNALVKLLRLATVTSGFVKDDTGAVVALGTEKADLLAEVLEELRAGWDDQQEPVVVFGRFHHDLDAIRIAAVLAGFVPGELSGRRSDLQAWHDGEVNLLAVQLQAGGVGIDLTRARYVVYWGTDYSLGNYEQSRARVHRPGQTRPVTYIHLLARDTVDMQVRKALEAKADVVRFVIDDLREADHDRTRVP